MKQKLSNWMRVLCLFFFFFFSGFVSLSAAVYFSALAVIEAKETIFRSITNTYETKVMALAEARGFALSGPNKSRDELITENAQKYSISPDLIRAIIWKESRGRQYATSESNAAGLMQVLRSHAPRLGLKHWSQLYDEQVNIAAGSSILAWNLKATKGDVTAALEIYYRGMEPTSQRLAEGRVYAREVLNIFATQAWER